MFEDHTGESVTAREERLLAFWNSQGIFKKTILQRKDASLFSFYDGPPFATGLPHYGHLLAGTIKDVVPRYKTMKGYCVPRRFGWDCHGLPVEQEIEKAFQLSGAHAIEDFGIPRFNEECRKIVLRYTEEWKSTVARMGRWVDFDKTWHTMDKTYMESVWWVFKSLYEKGLVFRGFKVMPFSAKLGTPLSNFEASENYKDVDDPALTVAFELIDDPETALLAWTTTPWTLISNLAICANPDSIYVKIQELSSGKQYILAKERLSSVFGEPDAYKVLSEMPGKELAGLRYRPLFDYFAEREDAFRVIVDDFVTLEDGTGLVHTAPAFGESDFFACQRNGIELVCPVDNNGRFTEEIPEYAGRFVKDADKEIIARLKQMGRVFKQATIHHRYPFCYRSDTPLIYKAIETWFVAVEQIKEDLLTSNSQIHWMPSHIKDGRFGKWLEGARDWAISRNRYWGTPIPLWQSEDDAKDIIAIGSLDELEALTGKRPEDLHRHFIDDLVIEKEGKTYRRIPEVFDCWFESGSMPYAQNHYPFEHQELFKKSFPAEFIAEGLDQTRGWFYTLTILSTALYKKPAFKNVVVNGIVLAEDGAKMSKRLKNYPDPMAVVEKYGADAIRLYLLNSPAVKAEDLRFSERGVELVFRQFLIPMWNAYSFLATYARIYHWAPQEDSFKKPAALIDQWILSILQKLIHDVEEGMDRYDLAAAVDPFVAFIDHLTNWYIRRSRPRFWSDQDTQDRKEAFETLYRVLLTLSKIAAPFVPFMSDALYQSLRSDEMQESVHLADFPNYASEDRQIALEEAMKLVQEIVSAGHALRKEHKLKVRQPLPAVYICTSEEEQLHLLQPHIDLIADELNVKQVAFQKDESQFVRLAAKPNFRVLGKKVGKLMRPVQEAVKNFDQGQLKVLASGHPLVLTVEGEEIALTGEDIEVERIVKEGVIAQAAGTVTVALDTTLTDELLLEGLARELKNKLNTMRRDAGLAVTDRIYVDIQATPRVRQAYETYRASIDQDVLAVKVSFGPCEGLSWDLNGEEVVMQIARA